MKKVIRYIIKLMYFFFLLVFGYLTLALIGTLIPTKISYSNEANKIPIYVISNGFHTDMLIPLQNESLDWITQVETDSISLEKYRGYKYISLGWGDEGFYMESFDNQFPSLMTTINAVLLPTESLMHIAFYKYDISEGEGVAKLLINEEQLEKLTAFAYQSFQQTENQKFIFYHRGYDEHDYFFKANGSYHLFNTCNAWTNNALKEANLPASLWSPFAQGVIWRVKSK